MPGNARVCGRKSMNDQDNAGDEPLLAGYGAMARYLTGKGLRTGKSTLQKRGAPSVNDALPPAERFPIKGYWGVLPVTEPRLLLDWALRQLHPSRSEPPPSPAPLASVPPAPAPKAAVASPRRKRGRPPKVSGKPGRQRDEASAGA
jgi:hypothetical protein